MRDLSHLGITHPAEAFSLADAVNVRILDVDTTGGRVSVGLA